MLTMSPEEIVEIQVRPTKELSPEAQVEVNQKLETKSKEFLAAYRGFASITYVRASPTRVKGVDPIEGEFRNLFAKVMAEYRSSLAVSSV